LSVGMDRGLKSVLEFEREARPGFWGGKGKKGKKGGLGGKDQI